MGFYVRTLAETFEFGMVAHAYQALREKHPTVPARLAYQYARDGGDGAAATFEQFVCGCTRGHEFPRDIDERDRCLCCWCGADGDA